jgi:hypothetical protein
VCADSSGSGGSFLLVLLIMFLPHRGVQQRKLGTRCRRFSLRSGHVLVFILSQIQCELVLFCCHPEEYISEIIEKIKTGGKLVKLLFLNKHYL